MSDMVPLDIREGCQEIDINISVEHGCWTEATGKITMFSIIPGVPRLIWLTYRLSQRIHQCQLTHPYFSVRVSPISSVYSELPRRSNLLSHQGASHRCRHIILAVETQAILHQVLHLGEEYYILGISQHGRRSVWPIRTNEMPRLLSLVSYQLAYRRGW
jgi:hypothetical protein